MGQKLWPVASGHRTPDTGHQLACRPIGKKSDYTKVKEMKGKRKNCKFTTKSLRDFEKLEKRTKSLFSNIRALVAFGDQDA